MAVLGYVEWNRKSIDIDIKHRTRVDMRDGLRSNREATKKHARICEKPVIVGFSSPNDKLSIKKKPLNTCALMNPLAHRMEGIEAIALIKSVGYSFGILSIPGTWFAGFLGRSTGWAHPIASTRDEETSEFKMFKQHYAYQRSILLSLA